MRIKTTPLTSESLGEIACLKTGIYLSYHQRKIKQQDLADLGLSHIIIRTSAGNYIDPYKRYFYRMCEELGVKICAFHFLTEQHAGQARLFYELTKDLEFDSLYFDFEGHLSASKCKQALLASDRHFGKDVAGVYTSAGFARRLPDSAPWLANRSLWLASWRNSIFPNFPIAPAPWSRWDLWQAMRVSIGGVPTWLNVERTW